MTSAPLTLVASRRLLLDHLDMHPGVTVDPDLDPAEVGIVGDVNHRGGYHCGSDRVVVDDYSVVESSRDRTGLADWACALDLGKWSATVAGKRHDLRSMSVWIVAQCKAGAPDARDIREVIYSPDGQVVRRYDRLGIRSSGDDSHLEHTHLSYFRDAIKAGRDQTALFRRYLTSIGLLAAPAPAATPAPAPITKKGSDMILIKKKDNDRVYISWGAGRAHLTAPTQLAPLQQAGMPLITVASDAELDAIGGPLRDIASTPA
jgi:hypothetical protein